MQSALSAPILNGKATKLTQNVTGKKSKASKAPTKLAKPTAERIKFWATITMGIFMPLDRKSVV